MQSLNYYEQLKTRFNDNGGKLFFVDSFKNRAFSVVKELFVESGASSFICVVNKKKTALQIKAALNDATGEIRIISTIEEFRQMCRLSDVGIKGGVDQAKKFKQAYPKIIVMLCDDEKPVLHGQLYQRGDKYNEYLDGTVETYALSDFLADAAYDMLVVDDVYSMLAFEESDPNENITRTPKNHELVIIKGKKYYTDVVHSYKKLTGLADSAAKTVIISSCIVDNDVISFYAAASLIYNEFSFEKSKIDVRRQASNYSDEIEDLYNNVSYITDDEKLQSLCLQRAKGRERYIPGDLERLSNYIKSSFDFMTKEEIFLRAMDVAKKNRRNLSNQSILDMIAEDDNMFATTVCDMFFSEKLKGDVESNIESFAVAKMSEEDATNFFKVFGEYAFYCDTGVIGDRCKIYRVYHEDSGFEDLLRRSYCDFDRNENALSATHKGDDAAFKCITVKKLLLEKELKLPLLIVTNNVESDVIGMLDNLVEHKAINLPVDAGVLSGADIFVTNYSDYESIANNLNVASVVFFDAISDICLFDAYVKKSLNMGENVNSALLVTYDNLSGLLADLWQTTWTDENESIVSVKNSKLYIRGEKPVDYHDIVASIADVYNNFKDVIDKSGKVNVRSMTDGFCDTITSFTLDRAGSAVEIGEELGYLDAISPYYSAIFANSVSVGTRGRDVYAEQLVPLEPRKSKRKIKKAEKVISDKKKQKAEKAALAKQKKRAKRKKVKYVYGKVDQSKKVFFNVCTKQMHNLCDVRYKDCSVCELNQQIQTNDLNDFVKGVKGYFKETERLMSKIQSDRFRKQIDDTISTQSNSDGLAEVIDQALTVSKEANKTLNIMLKKKINYTAPFFAEYDQVSEIKDAVQSVHHMIFNKYFEQIMGILTRSTDEMKTSIGKIGRAAMNSLNTSQIGGKHGIN